MNQATNLAVYLEKCDEAYYVTGKALVTDETYDTLVGTLRKLDPAHPYLSKVGTKVQGDNGKVARIIPMGTLAKYNKEEDVQVWWNEQPEGLKIFAPKYDGFACELDYMEGLFILGSTRGDGIVGEDVTDAAKRVVPLEVPFPELRKVRGEFIIPKSNHQTLKDNGYKAMRNAVPGIIRSNSDMVPYVHFIAYEFFDGDNNRIDQRDRYNHFFNIEMGTSMTDFEDAVKMRNEWIESGRENFEYEVDGIVLKTDTIHEDDLSHPKHMISWKFKSNREATELTGVRAQLGVTGKFSPVGSFNEVEFQGATLTSASLGSFGRLKTMMEDEENPIKIGSIVEVSRRGDIIPYIEECTYTPDEATALVPLTDCPFCEHPVVYEGAEPYCRNNACPQLLQLRVQQYVGNTGMKGIGAGIISRLTGWQINSLADIYKMDAECIAELPRLGQSAVTKWKELQAKGLTASQFMMCLPFDGIGPAVWKQLLETMTIQEILDLDDPTLQAMKLTRFGEGKRSDFIMQKDALKDEINELLKYVTING